MIINFFFNVEKAEYNFSPSMIYVWEFFCSDTTAKLFIKEREKINEGACVTAATNRSNIIKWRKC